MADALTSPGRATAARARYERRVQARVWAAVEEYLALLVAMAQERLRADPLTAAGRRVPVPPVYSVASATEAWGGVVDVLTTAITDPMPASIRRDYARTLSTRLLADPFPGVAFQAVDGLMRYGAEQGWSNRQTLHELRQAVQPAPAGSEPSPWEARIRGVVRTEATAAYATQQIREMADTGYARKRWVSHHDHKVRDTHLSADGQTVPLDAPFSIGGAALQYPGDPMGPAAETANCRCVVVGVRWRGDSVA